MLILRIFLFGPPRIEHNSQTLAFGVRKGIALIVYLAVTGQTHSRDALATLFWPESNQQQARASLRRMLYQINQIFNTVVIMAERDLVRLHPAVDLWVDVAEFRSVAMSVREGNLTVLDDVAQRRRLENAVGLYTDEFMAGFSLPDCTEFDDWQFFQREELRQSLAEALEQLTAFYEGQALYEQAISFARRWLALDRMHEPVHRHLMRLYARAGQQAAALRQYEECVRALEEELGIQPGDETIDLYRAIRERRFPEESRAATSLSDGVTPSSPVAQPSPTPYPLPNQPLPLIGRETELAQLDNLLANQNCRLITLVGLGGMGKTHLALAAAHRLAAQTESHFPDGVLFVTLANKMATANPASSLIFALADALGLSLSGQTEAARQVIDFCAYRRMLIVLDNFEDFLLAAEEVYADSALDFIEAILGQASSVKLLITSREPLQLLAEWRMDLQGLSVPPSVDQAEADMESSRAYSAIHLFAQFARQVQPSFEITEQNISAIYRLCRLVAGSPLALKLAAAWVRLFTCERIVNDIEANMSLLSTQMRNIPLRQRSMRAIFDYTCHLLSPEEQRLFFATSVFRNGFTEAAVTAIAAATPYQLAALLDRGLIQVQSGVQGIRYTLHDLTRQYAAERLTADPVYAQQIRDGHTRFYAQFLDGLHDAIIGNKQAEAVAAIHGDIDNVEDMWANLLVTGDLDSLHKVAAPVWRYHWSRTPAQMAVQFFSEAITYLVGSADLKTHSAYHATLRTLYAMRGEFYYFLGDYDLAHNDFEIALDLARQLGLRKEEMEMTVILSSISRWQGATLDAETRLSEALAYYRETGYRDGEADVQHELAQLYIYIGQYDEAKRCAEESLAISLELGRTDWIAWAIDALGWVSFSCGEYSEMRRYYTQSLAYFQEINHQLGIALAWGGLGMVAWAEGKPKWDEAQSLLEHSLARCRHLNHHFHMSSRLSILAQICNDAEQHAQAEIYAREGAEIAERVGSPLFTALNLCCLAESLYYRGDLAHSRPYVHQALRLAHAIEQMPALLIALLCYATLLVIESELLEDAEASQIAGRIQAVALLQRVADHPAGWAIYRQKSKRLLDEVSRRWPAPQISAAAHFTQAHSFEEQVQAILQDRRQQRNA